jgi:hypothetical protein
VNQRFTLDRRSFEQFIAAVSLFQPLQQAAAMKSSEENGPLLLRLLETLRAIDSGALAWQVALERVVALALQIIGGDGAVLWLFTSEDLICRAAAGRYFEDDHLRTALRSKLESSGAFAEDSPATLDLTRTLEKYSGSLGSSLVIAILPGGKIAGALAVFSDPSRTFTERDYANLRLLGGLAQYVLTRTAAGREPQDSLAELPEANPEAIAFLGIHMTSSIQCSARDPLISHEPLLEHAQIGNLYLPGDGNHVTPGGGMNAHHQIRAGTQSLWVSALLEPRKRMQRLRTAAIIAWENSLRRVRNVRVNWTVFKQATPAIAILAVMSFFVGILIGGCQPLAVSSLNTTAKAAAEPVTYASSSDANQEPAAMLIPKKSTAILTETSHLRTTDRETAATIAALSKYEVRNLRRAADYGDDEAALQLGMLYELGRGFPQSCTKAAEWVTKAAENGNAAAEYNLGLRYRDGDGVDVNLKQAEDWLRKAAHKNSNAERVLTELTSQ